MQNTDYLESVKRIFLMYKGLGDKSFAQIEDEHIHYIPDAESNSIAVIVKHLGGNMLSRWTDFLTTDGEKEWRNRDGEFVDDIQSKHQMEEVWEKGWACLFSALEGLSPDDLDKIVYIRNEGHTVMEAINRQLAHYPYHVGQIVYIAKIVTSSNWKSLSIPKNKSAEFNKEKFSQEKGKRHFV